MGWSPWCQKRRWFEYTQEEWLTWIESLPEKGFGRYTKKGWLLWAQLMEEEHGLHTESTNLPPTDQGPPPFPPATGRANKMPRHD